MEGTSSNGTIQSRGATSLQDGLPLTAFSFFSKKVTFDPMEEAAAAAERQEMVDLRAALLAAENRVRARWRDEDQHAADRRKSASAQIAHHETTFESLRCPPQGELPNVDDDYSRWLVAISTEAADRQRKRLREEENARAERAQLV